MVCIENAGIRICFYSCVLWYGISSTLDSICSFYLSLCDGEQARWEIDAQGSSWGYSCSKEGYKESRSTASRVHASRVACNLPQFFLKTNLICGYYTIVCHFFLKGSFDAFSFCNMHYAFALWQPFGIMQIWDDQCAGFMYLSFSLHRSYNLGVQLAYVCFSIRLMLVACAGLRQEFVIHFFLLQAPTSGLSPYMAYRFHIRFSSR